MGSELIGTSQGKDLQGAVAGLATTSAQSPGAIKKIKAALWDV